MNKISLIALFGSTALLSACLPSNDNATSSLTSPPHGSYTLTCGSINVVNNTLFASCTRLDGSNMPTSLGNLDSCLDATRNGGDISNIDGNLTCVPDLPRTTGISFPRAETEINQWIYGGNSNSIIQHGWDIWSGLTAFTGEVDGQAVRAFSTWPTTSNIAFRMNNEGFNAQPRIHLEPPRRAKNITNAKATTSSTIDTNILVNVSYNPPAADHAIDNKLFWKSTLDTYLRNGYTDIPNFPDNSITIKPVYKHIPKDVANGIYTFPGWPGTPSPAKTFPESDWGACVYVDINKQTSTAHSIDKGCQSRSAANTFALSDFIYYQVTPADKDYLSGQAGTSIAVGDYLILVGMHVTSREIKRWTWQTFFWSANKNQPFAPSSQEIAQLRPDSKLDAAAQHYAMSIAYQMVEPAQPIINGSNNSVSSVDAYNPHLEAGFDPTTFEVTNPLGNKYGVQTNCMSCHLIANYNPKTDYSNGDNREKPYAADMYISLDDPMFNKTLRLDFAWSILGKLQLNR